jgi:hypothetical protein
MARHRKRKISFKSMKTAMRWCKKRHNKIKKRRRRNMRYIKKKHLKGLKKYTALPLI